MTPRPRPELPRPVQRGTRHRTDGDFSARGRGPTSLAVVVPAVLGALGLFVSSRADKGSDLFFAATFFSAAVYLAAWVVFGAARTSFAPRTLPRDLLRGVVGGAVLLGVFSVGALAIRDVPSLAAPVDSLLDNARVGSVWATVLTTCLNGIGEELFFRRVVPRNLPHSGPALAIVSVALYMAVSAAMGVPLLVFAALVIGTAAYWLARRTGSLTSSVALHLTWTLGMLAVLPPLI